MRYLLVLGVFSATTLTYAKDVVCPAGKSNSQVAVEAGDTIGYQTQAGATYEKNTNCVTKFTLDNSCKKIKFSCDSFNLGKGDLMIVKIGKKSKKFKGKKFKKPIVSTKTTLITFKSNKKKEGPGALCSMECIKSAATAAPTPPPTTGGGGGSGGSSGGAGTQDEYCAISSEHTMCLYEGPSDACAAKTVFREMSEVGKQQILDKHNELRAKVARGDETASGGQPKASNMRKLVWNDELAVIAQRWADQCTFAHDPSHDMADGTSVGQNLFTKGSSNQADYETIMSSSPGEFTEGWYLEVESPGFSPDDVNPFVFSEPAGHYTQVVWAETEQVGCGFVYYTGQVGPFVTYNQLLVCNYAKGGNIIGTPMYKIGEPCSQCDDGYTCESDLCSKN